MGQEIGNHFVSPDLNKNPEQVATESTVDSWRRVGLCRTRTLSTSMLVFA